MLTPQIPNVDPSLSVLLSLVTHSSLFSFVDISVCFFGCANLGGVSAFGGIHLGGASLSLRNGGDWFPR